MVPLRGKLRTAAVRRKISLPLAIPSSSFQTFASSSSSAAAAAAGPKKPAASPHFDHETDVLIIGSGAGALTAALRAKSHGLDALVVEKERTLGGASAISGGGLWIPCNPVSRAAGVADDSKAAALRYFEQAVGDVGPASSPARRRAFVDNGPAMVAFLQARGFRFHFSSGYPDYYPRMEGAMGEGGGRTIESRAFDTRKLGPRGELLPPEKLPAPIYTNDAALFARLTSSPRAFAQATWRMLPIVARMALGQKLTSLGRALVAQLLYLNVQQNTDIRTQIALHELIQDREGGGVVVGAKLRTSTGSIESVRARRGVILAAGGFARNKGMREKFLPSPASTEWTSSPKGDTGDAISEGIRLGAATALLDDAWWGPTIFDPVTGAPHFALIERARPHCIIVDAGGRRFMNEAQSYTDAGHDQYARNKEVKAIPAWLIMDTNHRNRYMLGSVFPRVKPKKALAEGKVFAASTVEDLARQIGVDAEGLKTTVADYNVMCKHGVDGDFGKGENAYDQFFGDPAIRPNPNMGPLSKAPFYAIPIWPGDLGTKGGLLTDEFQRVVRQDGEVIQGLGAGSTLGPAMTHGFIAANYMAGCIRTAFRATSLWQHSISGQRIHRVRKHVLSIICRGV